MIELVIEQKRKDLGGFEVGRVLPVAHRRMVGPFIFFDHMGPADFPPNIPIAADVRPHPHIGLSTLSYLFEGEITHRDSVGSDLSIRPGAVNWMTSGRGITHSERFDGLRARGGRFNGIQSWIALPTEMEEIAPCFTSYREEELPVLDDAGLWLRLITGEAYGLKSPVAITSPTLYAHVILEASARASLPSNYTERAVYVVDGCIEVEGQTFKEGQMVVFRAGQPAEVTGVERAVVMLLGGEPLGHRFMEWNFVSSSRARIEQAKADWRAGRMKLPDHDNAEFIPLPAEPSTPPNPMS
jgi:redox-sensitive bicupin YhaK (pirin superfamily)